MATSDLTLDAGALTAAHQEPPGGRLFLVVQLDGVRPWVVVAPDGCELSVGRTRAATISIDHESVSRVHAKIRRRGTRLELEDLESRNGIMVNGGRVARMRELTAGDEIVIGPLTIIVGTTRAPPRNARVADADAFEARLVAELDHATRYRHCVALAMIRVVGDDTVVDSLARAVRPMDLVGDFGGDHFALLLPRLAHDEAAAAIQRLIGEARGLHADVRAGVAVAPEDGVVADELLARARSALRQARTTGGLVMATSTTADVATGTVIASPAMRRIYALVDRIADSNFSVLILGETGVGKELIAEALHRRSQRREQPLLKVNCAAITDTLLESELFGHERGAFTGADRRKLGYFESAHTGTIFLDEIGEMPPALQAKLLRVLEHKVVTRVGGVDEIAIDVRVVAATHRDVESEVRAGRFREDLYFRLAGFTLAVPPLRDRVEEIVPLAQHFIRKIATETRQPVPELSPDAQLALQRHDWPGNVRELRNAVERAIVVQAGGTILVDDLPERLGEVARRAPAPEPRAAGASQDQLRDQLLELERQAIVEALAHSGGNQTRAAGRLGVSRRALIYKMERFGLKRAPAARTPTDVPDE